MKRDAEVDRLADIVASDPGAEDTARLTWIECNSARVTVFDPPSGDAWIWEVYATDDDGKPTGAHGCNSDLRRAIDSAMDPTSEAVA